MRGETPIDMLTAITRYAGTQVTLSNPPWSKPQHLQITDGELAPDTLKPGTALWFFASYKAQP